MKVLLLLLNVILESHSPFVDSFFFIADQSVELSDPAMLKVSSQSFLVLKVLHSTSVNSLELISLF